MNETTAALAVRGLPIDTPTTPSRSKRNLFLITDAGIRVADPVASPKRRHAVRRQQHRRPQPPVLRKTQAANRADILRQKAALIEQAYHQFAVATGFSGSELPTIVFAAQHDSSLSVAQIREQIAIASNLLTSLTSRPLARVLADEFARDAQNPFTNGSQGTFRELETLNVRSGGIVRVPTHAEKVAYYAQKLEGITHVNQAYGRRLRPLLSEYFAIVLGDPELTLAPQTLNLETGFNQRQDYTIIYSLERMNDILMPTGTVTIPSSVYERNQPKAGRPSPFQGLPHGIVLRTVVVDNPVQRSIHG